MFDMSRDYNDRQEINEYVGRAIRNLRQAQNITLTELADRLKLSYQQVQKYETGTNRVGADMLYEIAMALKVDVNMFFPYGQLTQQEFSSKQVKLMKQYGLINDEQTKEILADLINRLAGLDIVS